jgi:hypothetical protein
LKVPDILQVKLDNSTLGASVEKNLTRGRASIFVENNLRFSQIELMQFCKEQDIECCAVQLDTKLSKLCLLAKKTENIRVKQERRSLYKKKQFLNMQLFKLYLY